MMKLLKDRIGRLIDYRIDIVLAIVGVLGSLAVTSITSAFRMESADRFQARYNGFDIQYGHLSGSSAEDATWTLDKILPIEEREANFRKSRHHIRFDRDFSEIPTVIVNLAQLHSTNNAHLRIMMNVENATRTGCDIVISTWSDSKIYWVEMDWFAFQSSPQLPSM
jgi:H-type lectin domain